MNEQQENSYSHILKYTSLFGGVQGIVIVIGLIRNKAMALLLGAGGMGFNALLMSIQNFASQCTNLGISFAGVPKLSELYERDDRQLDYYIRVIRLWSMIAAGLGLVFCICISPFVDEMSFSWGNHTLHFAMLGLAVAMAAVAGGELAILKATRRLSSLATIQSCTAVGGVLLSVPLYYFWHHSGVVPAIVMVAALNMVVTTAISHHYHPYLLQFERRMVKDGIDMVKLGVAFVLAAAIGSCAEMLIRSFLSKEGGLNDLGLYNAAFTITITYAGMVFSAMETDFFPRLSAVCQNIEDTNVTVNKQMEVSLLLLSPMLVLLMIFLPVLIPLLFSKEFVPVIGMAQVAVLAMYFKVLTLPVAYITLARRRSLAYLFLESAYFVVFVVAVMFGFKTWGVYGAGIAIVVAHVFDYLLINGFAYWKYGYRRNKKVVRSGFVQVFFGFAAFALTLTVNGIEYWLIGSALVMVSAWYSISTLRQNVSLWNTLKRKLLHRNE